MMGLVKFLQKRPSDKMIMLVRIFFGAFYIGIMYYNLITLGKEIDNTYLFGLFVLDEDKVNILKYIMISIGIFPILIGITNLCVLKKKYFRIMQIIVGILLFYISSSIKESPNLDFDIIIFLMGFFPLFAGITGKCITTKCLKYKEKITKIRV